MQTSRPASSPPSAPLALLVLAALLWPASPAAAQVPAPPPGPPPGWVQVDDMYLPASAVFGEGYFTAVGWPNHTVNYAFDPAVTIAMRADFRVALAELSAIANLSFVEGGGQNYLYVRRNPASTTVSSSSIGLVGGGQNLNIGDEHWDDKYVIAHEIFHALGFLHEQCRFDRDLYVTIVWWNIESNPGCGGSCAGNFQMQGGVPTGPYDYLSIMHYGDHDFSDDDDIPTILCTDPAFQGRIGNRSFFSNLDAQALALRYGAPLAPTITAVSPLLAVAGDGPITLTVLGTKFLAGSLTGEGVNGTRVLWNGTALETTWVDAGAVTAVVPATLLAASGTAAVSVRNDALAGGQSAASFPFVVLPAPCGTTLRRTGWAVTGTGDVNADGVPDWASSAPGDDSARGMVELFSGATGARIGSSVGAAAGAEYGEGLASLPDVNGDGRRDLLVGAPSQGADAGAFYVRALPSMTTLISWGNGTAGERMGQAVAAAGDVDGDGDQEFLVGVPGANGGRGRIEVWSVNGGIVRTHAGTLAGAQLGAAVAGGEDVDGDGRPDYAAGAPTFNGSNGLGCGRIYVYSGATGAVLFSRDGDAAGDDLGRSVALVPSTNSTTATAHTAAGAPLGGTNDAGYVRIWRGYSTFSPYTPVTTFTGLGAGHRLGFSLASAGDADQDGCTDLLAGATMEGVAGGGAVGPGFVKVLSAATGNVLHSEQPSSLIGPTPAGSRFGFSAALIGDVDGDTRPDFVAGQPYADSPCPNHGDTDLFEPRIPPALGRVLITEVSAATPDGIEITNFGDTTAYLTDWRVKWKDGSTLTSAPLAIYLNPGESAIVMEPGAAPVETPPGTQVVQALPIINTGTGDFTVALVTATGWVVDEVRVAGTSGLWAEGGLGGRFRGVVRNEQSGPILGFVHAERAPGLDSDSGADWTSHGVRSFGLPNACAGIRGTDPIPLTPVRINEIDDSPDLLELVNASSSSADLRGWYVLASGGQGSAHAVLRPPFDGGLLYGLLPAGGFAVLGEGATQPAEKPAGVPYLNVTAAGGPGFPWTTEELDCALYDDLGRVVDLVRSTGHDDTVAHNHPRAPSLRFHFVGAAVRGTNGDRSFGRLAGASDTNEGRNFCPFTVRSMGGANPNLCIVNDRPQPPLDVRIDAGAAGPGLHALIDAGPLHAGEPWSFTFSGGHLQGNGPLLGLGPDALANYTVLVNTPPFSGLLDARGAARFDFPAGSLPAGLALDTLWFLHDPVNGAIDSVSFILEFDT